MERIFLDANIFILVATTHLEIDIFSGDDSGIQIEIKG